MAFYEFEGKQREVSDGAFVHPEAIVICGVTIGEGCYVGVGAPLRGDWCDIVVGPGSNIEENCVIHVRPDEVMVVGPSRHIGHGAMIHGATLGEHVMAGMHAIIHDGVVIGDEALSGTGFVGSENVETAGGRTVVGAPGKIVGDVSDEQKAAWKWGIELYQDLLARCHRNLCRL